MSTARDPVALLRFALREGDHALAVAVVQRLRDDTVLVRRAEAVLRSQQRVAQGPDRP
jgi:hypothetical protein